MTDGQAQPPGSDPDATDQAPGNAIAFVGGACADDGLLRHHILAPVKAALRAQTPVLDLGRAEAAPPGALRVSLFPNVPGDVLMMFDLADRNHFRQFDPDKRPYAATFRKVLVPGDWLRRQLLADDSLHLADADVLAVGSPRIDYLRAQAAAQPAKAPGAALTVLFVPLHDNWLDAQGQPMSMARGMAPCLAALRAGCDLRIATDGRNKESKRPVTQDLLDADIVITDYTSVMYEAWALGKPVIFPRWPGTERLLDKAPHCAEAHVYRDRIGHHPDSPEALLALLAQGRALPLGPGVAEFMADYLANWAPPSAAPPSAAAEVARLLERLADPGRAARERAARHALDGAVATRDWPAAESAATDLSRRNPDDAGLLEQLAQAFGGQGKTAQELETLESMARLAPPDAAQWNRLGTARSRMGRSQGAAAAFDAALRLAPQTPTADHYYRVGLAYETEGCDGPPDPEKSAAAYARAVDLAGADDPGSAAARFGHGALHAAAGRWQQAQTAYRARLADHPLDAGLHHQLGVAHERCHDWEQAEAAHTVALTLDLAQPAWHYRLGFVRERQEKFDSAAAAYLYAAELQAGGQQAGGQQTGGQQSGGQQAGGQSGTPEPGWFYRAGYALEKAGRLSDACTAYLRVCPPDADAPAPGHAAYTGPFLDRRAGLIGEYLTRRTVEAGPWMRHAEALEQQGDLAGAAQAAACAVQRSETHQPAWHHRLGRLLMRMGDLPGACAAFRDQQILQRPHATGEDRAARDDTLPDTAAYREFHDVLPIRENTILYEAFGGLSLTCNPLAIFERLLDDPRFAGWTHVWSLDNLQAIPARYADRRDVVFVRRGSLLYQRYLATCRYLINNSTFPVHFVRRDGQEYLNTWHGTPLKSLGYDIRDTAMQRANAARNLLQATLLISPNAHTEQVMLDRYGVRDLFAGASVITGYPRIDRMLNATQGEKDALRQTLGLDPHKPVVLYAPTYRGLWSTPDLEAAALIKDLERLQSDRYTLVFRGHYFAEKQIRAMDLPVIVASHGIDSCALLAVVDVVITDYSSIFFDFLPSRRPILHYIPDWDAYAASRGVYFGKQDLPGTVCGDMDTLLAAVARATTDPAAFVTPAYLDGLHRFAGLEDGGSTARVIEALFFGARGGAVASGRQGRAQILLHGGPMDPDDSTASMAALMRGLQHGGFATTLLVDRRVMAEEPGRAARADRLADRANVLVRSGASCPTPEEKWLNDPVNTRNTPLNDRMEQAFLPMLRFEARRILGPAHFDLVVDLHGQRPFVAQLFGAMDADRKAILLPGGTAPDRTTAPAALSRLLQTCRHFDVLLGVSDAVTAAARDALGPRHGLAAARFQTVDPMIDTEGIHALSQVSPRDAAREIQRWHEDERSKIVTVAPLTADQNHARLLEAMALLKGRRVDVSLALVGDGPERMRLQAHAARLGLKDRITFCGPCANPYPFIRAADTLVQPSDSDSGHGVLRAGMTLGIPCVATGGPGTRRLLADGLGLLAGPTAGALAEAIERMITGAFVPRPFDPVACNAQALAGFLAAVGLAGRA